MPQRGIDVNPGTGSATVGKSTLIKRYCENRFVQKYIPTIGIDYGVKPVRVLGHELKVNFFDTSGPRLMLRVVLVTAIVLGNAGIGSSHFVAGQGSKVATASVTFCCWHYKCCALRVFLAMIKPATTFRCSSRPRRQVSQR